MEQVLIGGFYDLLHTTDTEHNRISGADGNWGGVTSRQQLVATGGTLKKLRVELNDVPGTGTYVFSLYRGVGTGAPAVTALTCTVAADGTQASDMVNEVAVAAGDVVCLECNPDNPDNARYAKWSMVFEGDTAKESLLLGSTGTNDDATSYCRASGGGPSIVTENDVRCVCPTGGTIKNLYIWLSEDPGLTNDAYRFTLRIGGASQTLTCTITVPNRTGNDTAHPIAVSAGDILTLMIEPVSSPAVTPYVAFGMTFVATTDGESLILGGSSNDLDRTATEYNYLIPGISSSWTATEAERYQLAQECILKKLYMLVSDTPTGGSYVFTIRKNAASPGGGLTVTIADPATTGNDTTNEIAVVDDDELDIEVNPDSNPTARDAYWGLVGYIGPAPPPPPPVAVTTPFSVDPKPRTRMKFHPTLGLG